MEQDTGARAVKLIAIGNSKGIRLPKEMIAQYGWSDFITLESGDNGVLLRGGKQSKLPWRETYRAMATAEEDWSDFEDAGGDGID